jgi:hypothetical protein
MRILLLFLLSLIFISQSVCQEIESEKNDTTKLVIGNKVYKIYHKKGAIDKIEVDEKDTVTSKKEKKKSDDEKKWKKFGHWVGMDLGYTSLLNSNGRSSFQKQTFLENDPSKSFYVSLNLIEHKFPVIGNYLGFTTGLGFEWKKIGIKNNLKLNYNADSVWTVNDVNYNYDKNVLRATYVNIPLFLELNSSANAKKSWFLMFGIVGGMRVGSKFIQKLYDKKNEINKKVSGDYALNPYKLDASVRFGFKYVGLFTNFSLIPMFDTKRVEKALPLTFGLTWVW